MNARLNKTELLAGNQINFQVFGVKLGITASRKIYLREIYWLLERIFPKGLEKIEETEIEYHFRINSKNGTFFDFYRNDEKLIDNASKAAFFEMAESQIRVTIAEFAVGKIFLHAGVIGWKGRAIVIPARSFSGKTTLVAELVKRGASYYSDEYAVLDSKADVEPFPKWLSRRGIIDAYTQLDCPVESLGGVAGTETIPVGMVLIARYKPGKKIPRRWNPRRLSGGQAMMEIIPHTMPIRNKPKVVLNVLNKLVSRAIIVKTVRGEAAQFAETLLNYFESETD